MRTITPHHARLVPPQAERVFKGVLFDVYQWQAAQFDGKLATFEMLKRADTVKVIAIRDDKIVTVVDEQPTYRPKLTLPGGRHDVESETELDCAKRELHEETGLVYKKWKLLSAYQPYEKIEQFVYIFLATELQATETNHPDSGEKITIRDLSFQEARRMAQEDTNPYWPNHLLRQTVSLAELLSLPDYT